PWRRATTAARSWPRSRPGRCGPRSSTPRSRGPRACASSPTSSAGPSRRRPRRDREARRSPVMDLYPAIDLRDGRCVRLYQGDYARETVYAYDPVGQARGFVAGGASWIHIVDLDAARTGEPRNYELVATVAAAVDVPVQCGGGVRNDAAADALLSRGVRRVVVGTAALERPDWVRSLAGRYPGQVAVGLDARGRDVAVRGWVEGSGHDLVDVARSFEDAGV